MKCHLMHRLCILSLLVDHHVACVVANNTAIMVGTGMSLADLPERMATLGIIYKTVEAYLLIIVTSGKFDLWSTMGIFELNQACTRRTCSGSSPSASGSGGRALATVFRGVATTALDAKGNADNVSELAVRDGRAWGDARELEELLGVGAAIVDFSKKYQDSFSAPPGLVWRWPTEGSKSSKAPWGGC